MKGTFGSHMQSWSMKYYWHKTCNTLRTNNSDWELKSPICDFICEDIYVSLVVTVFTVFFFF